jgi:hypothetical protein
MDDVRGTIIKEIVNEVKNRKDKWLSTFNTFDKYKRIRVIKELHLNYCNTIVNFVNERDTDIRLLNIGSLKIKPSRKQYIDLRKDGVEPEEAIKIVKRDFRVLNHK